MPTFSCETLPGGNCLRGSLALPDAVRLPIAVVTAASAFVSFVFEFALQQATWVVWHAAQPLFNRLAGFIALYLGLRLLLFGRCFRLSLLCE